MWHLKILQPRGTRVFPTAHLRGKGDQICSRHLHCCQIAQAATQQGTQGISFQKSKMQSGATLTTLTTLAATVWAAGWPPTAHTSAGAAHAACGRWPTGHSGTAPRGLQQLMRSCTHGCTGSWVGSWVACRSTGTGWKKKFQGKIRWSPHQPTHTLTSSQGSSLALAARWRWRWRMRRPAAKPRAHTQDLSHPPDSTADISTRFHPHTRRVYPSPTFSLHTRFRLSFSRYPVSSLLDTDTARRLLRHSLDHSHRHHHHEPRLHEPCRLYRRDAE